MGVSWKHKVQNVQYLYLYLYVELVGFDELLRLHATLDVSYWVVVVTYIVL